MPIILLVTSGTCGKVCERYRQWEVGHRCNLDGLPMGVRVHLAVSLRLGRAFAAAASVGKSTTHDRGVAMNLTRVIKSAPPPVH